MPICHRLPPEQERDDKHEKWREPPGYLGEAVRRAKQIGGLKLLQQAPDTEPQR